MEIVKSSIYSFGLEELRDYLKDKSFAKYAADQIFNWIYKRFELDSSNWSNVSKKIKDHVQEQMSFFLPRVHVVNISKDGTHKFLLEMQDGYKVETVAIPSPKRLTLCVSSQVGCAVGCNFCHTGTMGFKRNLTVDEVIGQYLSVVQWFKLNGKVFKNQETEIAPSNIVYMGQGEPLHNFEVMKRATLLFLEPKGLGIGQRKITLSTSGVVPVLKKLEDFPPVNIAISLHAADDKTRIGLMPIAEKYNLEKLFSAINKIPLKAHRTITYEYLLIDGLNDRDEDVKGLMRLLDKKTSKINIIPFNEYPNSQYKRPSETKISWFKNQLLENDFVCTTRVSKGSDIMAACGQLKSKFE